MEDDAMTKTLTSLPALIAISLAVPAIGMGGGGGGGGGSMPSESAPRYDPAEEYRNGIAALQAKNFKAAKTAFDRVTSMAPKDANSQYLGGLARQGLNDWKGANKSFAKAAKLDPSMIKAQQELGISFAKLGNKAKAQEVLTGLTGKATQCGTTCPQAADLKAAVTALQAAIGGIAGLRDRGESLMFASSGDGQYLQAVSLINERRYEDAIASLKSAQLAFGPHPDILTYLGFANRKMGRFDVAEGYYKAALLAAPTHRGATEYYGELMVERGDLAGAKAMLARLDTQCRFGCAEAEELRGWITAGRSPHS
jgi:tetratricopeptide (TPR) repeat protein